MEMETLTTVAISFFSSEDVLCLWHTKFNEKSSDTADVDFHQEKCTLLEKYSKKVDIKRKKEKDECKIKGFLKIIPFLSVKF